MKVINIGPTGLKKQEAGERTSPLASPYRERAKKKEQLGLVCTSSQLRARVRAYMREAGWDARRRYDEAGAAADEIIATCFGSADDHDIWAARMYEYPWAIRDFVDMAHEKASCERAGELKSGLRAFQRWININYPKGGTQTL